MGVHYEAEATVRNTSYLRKGTMVALGVATPSTQRLLKTCASRAPGVEAQARKASWTKIESVLRITRDRDVSAAAHDLPQDTPTPRRSTSWKPKKRESDEAAKEKVVIPKAKKPITKSYISQTALSL